MKNYLSREVFAVRRSNDPPIMGFLACFASSRGDEMRRSLAPWIILAVVGLLAGVAYRYFADDPAEATLANYLRRGFHAMALAPSCRPVPLHFPSRHSDCSS